MITTSVTDPHTVQRRSLAQRNEDRRRYHRVQLALNGRLMMDDGQEFSFLTRDISPGGLALTTAAVGKVGRRVVAYVDQIGRIEGHIVRLFDGGFAIEFSGTLRRKDKLAARLTWLVNRDELNLPDERRHERTVLKTPRIVTISLSDGREYQARIIDMSLSGAAIAVSVRPPLGSSLKIGDLRATVVRHFDEGIAIEFATVQTPASLQQANGFGPNR